MEAQVHMLTLMYANIKKKTHNTTQNEMPLIGFTVFKAGVKLDFAL